MSLTLPRTIELAPDDVVFLLSDRRCYRLKRPVVFSVDDVGTKFFYERCSMRTLDIKAAFRHPCRHEILRIKVTVSTIVTAEATQSRLFLKMRMDEKSRIKQILMHLAQRDWNRFINLDPKKDQGRFRRILFGSFQAALKKNGYQLLETNFNLEYC